jgi:hypothetical protein
MRDLETELPALMGDLAAGALHRADLAGAVRAAARRHRATRVLAAAAAVVLAAAGGWWADRGDAVVPARSACEGSVRDRVLPEWARTGFSDPAPVASYATGLRGELVAILFGPLQSPPLAGADPKILWVARDGGVGPLRISARLEGTDVVEDVVLPDGAGPSVVEMPRPGCWLLDLTWSGGQDSLALAWEPVTPP